MSCGVGHRGGSDLAWLWLAAVAQIQLLAWEPPYATSVALKMQKKKKNREFFQQTKNEYSNTKPILKEILKGIL